MQAIWKAISCAAGIALLGLVSVYGLSEWKMRRVYDAPLLPLRASAPPDPVAGRHMARVVGCWLGCHGDEGEGGFEAIEGIRRITAPTLSQVVPQYSDTELARLVRFGVMRDGRSAVGMYAGVFWPLGDQDLADIFAHLRAQRPRPPVERSRQVTLRGRIALLRGEWAVSAEQVDRSRPRWGDLPRTTPYERGRYLASIVCSECHGLDYRGYPLEGGPSLAILAIYDRAQFRHLLTTGTAIGGSEIPKMSWAAEGVFTEREIDDLYSFLREYHGLPVPADSPH